MLLSPIVIIAIFKEFLNTVPVNILIDQSIVLHWHNLLQNPQSFRYSHHMHWLQLISTLPVFHFGPCAICDQNSQHGKDRDWFAWQCWYFSGLGTEWTGKGHYSNTQHVNSQSANVLLLPNQKKVNSYKERKNNSYNTEKLL